MKLMALDCMLSVYGKLDPQHKDLTFELFGLDFMIDNEFKPWLIEVNTNPSLDTQSPLLSKIIPTMIENLFRVVVDPIFPPPYDWPLSRRSSIPESCFESNKWEIIFDERDAWPKKKNEPELIMETSEDEAA
mmetsp:Transcript_37710/g.33742  ORF Transcript_37710/g.33742 Transcript_37710/m.33742 type:complete len:132 (+) Transcript_37710:1648-2043(+)|eukprot:CAMPEP_0114577390 /NCGR_PEP_ID=MMETSP0125-20121206/2060_1 /TAXON_ID=485358 ORGANISM="Aristerostoma sp., Strain ATCC 50986" /NCGR_SAMPLE_ID=MMETSP0125 /ASSEMBLY_ACC=CAM_ASM_000245 /LENGTH=131 /DNA_ID=CAMNT_0001766673 /DNA_START=2520 /DNA_END=2915 /DNA_ORIENTATION=-